MRVLVMVGLLAACDRDPAPPNAVGRLVFDPPAPRLLGTNTELPDPHAEVVRLLDTEVAALRHAALLDGANRRAGSNHLRAGDIVVRRVPDSRIVEIGVRHADARVAAQLCNALIDEYIERRFGGGLAARDVHVLDRCKPRAIVKRR